MKKILIAAVAAMSMVFAGGDIVEQQVVQPELTGFYGSVGYAYIDGEATSLEYGDTAKVSNNAIDLRAGYNINEYIAVEARYAIGAEDTVSINGNDEDVQADYDTWGIFIKPQYPVTTDISVYALLGYGNVTGDLEGYEELDENGFQWGLGAKYGVTQNVELFVDYINVYNDDIIIEDESIDLDVYTVSVGVTYKF